MPRKKSQSFGNKPLPDNQQKGKKVDFYYSSSHFGEFYTTV